MENQKEQNKKYQKIIADIGAGNAKRTYREARNNPQNLYYTIEPNKASYEEIEKKSSLKESKGGLNNLNFVNSSIEDISEDYQSMFDEIYIYFPWGSLLTGVVLGEEVTLEKLLMIAKDDSKLTIVTTYNDKFEKEFRVSKQLPILDDEYISTNLKETYSERGINLIDFRRLSKSEVIETDSSWGKKLIQKRDRDVFILNFDITKL